MTLTAAPEAASISVTELPNWFATHTWVPSEFMPIGQSKA